MRELLIGENPPPKSEKPSFKERYLKVKDVLMLSDCIVDIYYKGQYVERFVRVNDIKVIPEWVLGAEVTSFDVDTYAGISILEINSR